jgi:cytidyltransferase-like protein
MVKKVFVSGCYDLLHSGHVAFFQEAASYGELYVAIGSDKTVFGLKGRLPVNNENERLYMVKSLACVKEAFISSGSGVMDFKPEIRKMRPHFLIVNEDGDIPEKQALCIELGIKYVVMNRTPYKGLQARSSTDLRQVARMPYRIDVAGGWLDQPYVSKLHPGSVITISLEPTYPFNERSGMATSTRKKAMELWGNQLPAGDTEKIARILFAYDNPPGTDEVSGSQDTIGIVYPGLSKSYYSGRYWPTRIDSVQDENTLRFMEESLYLIPLGPRSNEFKVLSGTNITLKGARHLAHAADDCWDAILRHDRVAFGNNFRAGFEAQVEMFPNMLTDAMTELIKRYRKTAYGWKVSGAGGGGYIILVSETPIEDALRITIRRDDFASQRRT